MFDTNAMFLYSMDPTMCVLYLLFLVLRLSVTSWQIETDFLGVSPTLSSFCHLVKSSLYMCVSLSENSAIPRNSIECMEDIAQFQYITGCPVDMFSLSKEQLVVLMNIFAPAPEHHWTLSSDNKLYCLTFCLVSGGQLRE